MHIYKYMRKRREILDGFSYHITARINRQEFLFESNEIKEMFMNVLRRTKSLISFVFYPIFEVEGDKLGLELY